MLQNDVASVQNTFSAAGKPQMLLIQKHGLQKESRNCLRWGMVANTGSSGESRVVQNVLHGVHGVW